MILSFDDAVGFLAAASMIVAFCSKRMIPLRVAAIAANLLFIAYATRLHLMPVLALHCLLLPLNVLRLITAVAARDISVPESEQTRLQQEAAAAFEHESINRRRWP